MQQWPLLQHDKQVVHRDLKAENIYFTSRQQVKLGDFGFSTTCVSDQTLTTFCGSPPYAAPELFCDDSYYGPNVDVWALGILLYFMVVGVLPFRAETIGKLKRCILDGVYTMPEHVSDDCRLLIRGILRPAPSDRYSIREICDSDWLSEVEFPEPMEPYTLGVDVNNRPMTEAEVETRRQLEEMGMSEQHVEAEMETRRQLEEMGMSEQHVEVEMETRRQLEEMGMSEQHVEAAMSQQSRSSVAGTYHILLHSIQKRLAAEAKQAAAAAAADIVDTDADEPVTNLVDVAPCRPVVQPLLKKPSKVCVIL